MKAGNEVRAWRRTVRTELLARRGAIRPEERLRAGTLTIGRILAGFPDLEKRRVGFYWPIRGEIDLRPLARELCDAGGQVSLPVITARNEPLSFARWSPGMRMIAGTWNIPVPSETEWTQPTALLIPTLGFDAANYRLGYGGGYYDRTLSTMNPKPMSIGVGYEFGRLETIFPQPYDVALDAIVTESAVHRTDG